MSNEEILKERADSLIKKIDKEENLSYTTLKACTEILAQKLEQKETELNKLYMQLGIAKHILEEKGYSKNYLTSRTPEQILELIICLI